MCELMLEIQLKLLKMTKNDLQMTFYDLQMTLRPYTSLPPLSSPKMLQKLSNIRVPNSFSFGFIDEKHDFSPFLGRVDHFLGHFGHSYRYK